MLRLGAIASLAALTACQSAPPTNCEQVSKEAHNCLHRFEGANDDRKMLLACFPFSGSEKMTGAWVVGFETNSFYEGAEASPDLLKFESTLKPDPRDTRVTRHATLVMGPKMGPALPQDGKDRALQIVFVGRRERCPIVPPDDTIIVDRVLSTTIKDVTG